MDQINLFEMLYEPYKITKPIRLIELFAGIGSQAKALERLGVNFEHHKVVEFDKYAIKSYNAIHGTNFKTSDITKIHAKDLEISNTDEFTYLLTYSFPCQDLSLAGKGKGMEKGSGTRSGLLWEVERILNECDELPQILLMENVPQVHGKKNMEHFKAWIEVLEKMGYSNYWQDLNAKNFGIPQNRNRCFMVSILGNYKYEFPKPFELKLRLKDMLEDEVDEKYYLKDELLEKVKYRIGDKEYNLLGGMQKNQSVKEDGISTTLTSSMGTSGGYVPMINEPVRKYGIFDDEKGKHQAGSVWDKDGLSPTLDTMQGGYRQPCIEVREKTKKGYAEAYEGDGAYINRPHQKRGCVQKGMIQTLKTSGSDVGVVVSEPKIMKYDIPQTVKVRKYEVDTNKLVDVLRTAKCNVVLTNKDIADKLGIPITKVEHWFRKDDSFAIPDAEIWYQLKGLLNIETDEFDESIMTFEEREGVYEKSNRCYHEDGISPTLTSVSADEKIITDLRIRKLTPLECYRLMGFDDEDFYKAEKVNSNTQLYKQAGNSICVSVLEEIFKKLF